MADGVDIDAFIRKKAFQRDKSHQFSQGSLISANELRGLNDNSDEGQGPVMTEESEERQHTEDSLQSDQSPMRMRGDLS